MTTVGQTSSVSRPPSVRAPSLFPTAEGCTHVYNHPATPDRVTHPTRRRVLALGATGAVVALSGCGSTSEPPTPLPPEATVTIQLRNRDDQPREYKIVVNQGESVTDSFSGVLPADQSEPVEMVATFRASNEQHDFSINTAGGQSGRTWDPTECDAFFIDAFIENGSPGFETQCRSN